jgi:hypothetical protein
MDRTTSAESIDAIPARHHRMWTESRGGREGRGMRTYNPQFGRPAILPSMIRLVNSIAAENGWLDVPG